MAQETAPFPARTLGPLEAQVVSWLEVERPSAVTVDDVSATFGWSKQRVYGLLWRLTRKGWLQRTTAGRYEPLLADTGGVALPNPWAALAMWTPPYYVALASAAYEQQLTPDRPAAVQACVPFATRKPKGWGDLSIALVRRRHFSLAGTDERRIHGHPIRTAGTEKILIDAASIPGRVGGVFGLAQIVSRAIEQADWKVFCRLAADAPRGRAASRRLAGVSELLGYEVPAELAAFAESTRKDALVYLGAVSTHGRRGSIMSRWRVMANVSAEALREEVRR